MTAAGLSLREAERGLKKVGFELVKTSPHRKWVHADGRFLTLPGKLNGDRLYGWLAQAVINNIAGNTEGRKHGHRD